MTTTTMNRDNWKQKILQAAYEAEVGDFQKLNALIDEITALQPATPPTPPTITIFTGAPGSGKTTAARNLSAQTGARHFETDQYLAQVVGKRDWKTGEYSQTDLARAGLLDASGVLLPNVLQEAIAWVNCWVDSELSAGRSVIVCGAFRSEKSLDFYRKLAAFRGATLTIVPCTGEHQSVHGQWSKP